MSEKETEPTEEAPQPTEEAPQHITGTGTFRIPTPGKGKR